ncbi:MAG: translation initiation factor IF-2 [Candidatus Ranarchaeia archaeon]|jgi:translation initiation factor 5B
MHIRSPIAVFLGHVDVGKTSLLDKIRGTGVQEREAGGITQHIGASFFPIATIETIAGDLIKTLKADIAISGLLIIDTPGHEAFWNLRSRGGAVSDIAILVIDITKGYQPQTWECTKILRSRKTPFLIAANMLDRIPGWESSGTLSFSESFKKQPEYVQQRVDEALYEIMGDLSREGISGERFDRITDFTKNVALIPTSAKTAEGIAELLFVLTGLTQQYLLERLQTTEGPAKGSILEVKEEVGIGTTVDAIIYDGILEKGQQIVVGTVAEPITTKVRALLIPKPLDEIRDPRQKFDQVDQIVAAAGVKIVAPELENAIAGAPIYALGESQNIEDIVSEIKTELSEIRVSTDKDGIILKADTLGSLEAVSQFIREEGITIRIADLGDVSYNDIMEAACNIEKNKYDAVVLAFNVKVLPDARKKAEELKIKIFGNQICYRLLEDFQDWLTAQKEADKAKRLDTIIKPGIIRLLPNHVFRSCKPAIAGIKVLAGEIKPKLTLIREDGEKVGTIVQIQDKSESVQLATEGSEVAVSIRGPTIGRQIKEGDTLYIDVPENHVQSIKKTMKDDLTESELKALDALIKIKRKTSTFWGI